MNEADRKMMARERDASPERFPRGGKEEVEEPVERVTTASSTSSTTTSRSQPRLQEIGISRAPTEADEMYGLERNNTALSRIGTGRSQHSATVGSGLRSRTMSRSSKPLPNFGAGKPFPPPLPEREEYVVEFDGPNDPMHAQNWPFKKK